MSVTEKLLLPLLADDQSRPLITHYDDIAGTRIELSRATAANWAAKTANWLCDELDVETGDVAVVRLPAHWQTLGVLLGAWWCGMHVTDDANDAQVAFVAPDGDGGGAALTAVVALDPMGMGLSAELGSGRVDYLSDIRLHGDHFSPLLPIPGDTPALHGQTVDQVVAAAQARATNLGNAPRVLSTLNWRTPGDVLDGVLAVLAAGGSLVQCSGTERDRLAERSKAEQITVELPGQA